jgi:universal stress protein A
MSATRKCPMKTKTTKRKITEAAVGAAVGGVIAGPIGAVAGGLAAGHVESGLERLARLKPPGDRAKVASDDPLIHAYPRCILVPLDFSPPSKRAMRFAREWAALFGAEVCLVHVVEPSGAVGDFGTVPVGMVRRDVAAVAKAALRELAQAEFPEGIPVTVAVRKGRAFEQIAATARDVHADVVIIGTHGHAGLRHALLGSTAERVARHAPCPVLILRRGPNR